MEGMACFGARLRLSLQGDDCGHGVLGVA